MTTMNISLPESLKSFVDSQVAEGDYQSSSEYVRELIRREKERLILRRMILDGLESPLSDKPLDKAYFDGLRARIAGSK